VDLILASHLFREAAQNADAAPLETTAELLLSGVVAFPAPSDGYAILGPSPDQARLHRAGGELSAGLRLLEVFADHVVLEHDGMREILRLPTSRKAADPADPALAAAPAPAPPSVSEPGGFVGGVIRAQPVFAGRRVRGYRVYEGQYGNSLQSLGLNPGDLVIEINGERLGDPGQAKVLLDRLARDPEIGVVVRRGSEERALHLDIATAVASARADADFIRAQQAAEVPDPIMRGRDRLLPPTVSDSP
jgi:general secretion pathway protein C